MEGRECAVGVDLSYPVDGAYTDTCVERGDCEEPFAVAHVGHVRHLPECAMLVGIRPAEEYLAVVCPVAVLVFVQRAGADAVFRCAYNNIFVAATCEEVWVAEVIGETSRATIDDYTLLCPRHEPLVVGGGFHDSCLSVIHRSVDGVDAVVVVIDTA